MGIIKNKDIRDKSEGNPVKELTDDLNALIEVEKKLVVQNKATAESFNLIKKSNDGAEAQKLIETTARLKKETQELTEVQKQELKIEKQIQTTQAQLIAGDKKEAQELAKLNANKKDQRDLNKANATLNDKLAGTEQKLLALNVKARLERKKLNTETKKGQTRLKELNAEIDKNNTKIKRNSDALKKQKIGIGAYGTALKGLGAKLVGAFAAVQGLRGAFNVLTGIIGSTAEGQIFLAKVTGATNAVMANLRDRLIDGWNAMTDFNSAAGENKTVIEKLGDAWLDFYSVRGEGFLNLFKSIGTFFKGDFEDGINGINDGFVQMTLGIEGATEKSKELINQLKIAADFGAAIAGAEKKLELDRSKFAIQEAKDIRTIADLRVKAADKANFSGEEREGFILRALALTRKLGAENVKFAERELGLQQAVFNSANSNIDDEIKLNKLKQKADEVAAASLKKQKLLTAELQTAKNEAAKEDLKNAGGGTFGIDPEFKRVENAKTANVKIENEHKTSLDKISSMNDEFRLREAGQDKASIEKRKANAIASEDAILQIKDAAIAAAGQILADSISFGIDAQVAAVEAANEAEQERNEAKAETDKAVLTQQLEDNFITEKEFKDQTAKIDEDLIVKNEKLEKDTKTAIAVADKKKALFDVGIATAVGVARVIPNPIAMALAAGLGALQLAVVAARPIPKFEKGEVNIKAPRHRHGGMLAEVEGGESYINRQGTSNAPNALTDINNGLLKDSDIEMMKNNDNYSYTMLQLNGLVDELKVNGNLTRETNKMLSKTKTVYDQGNRLVIKDIDGQVLGEIIKSK